jgi:CRISPR system Cascade subunit CasD
MSTAHLPLWFDAPLQSWGFASRFQRRATGLFPTRSGVLGLVCAAMGLPKGPPTDAKLEQFSGITLTVWQFPRCAGRNGEPLLIQRMEDYHTVAFTREASAKPSRVAYLTAKAVGPITAEDRSSEIKPTKRQYLLEARFGLRLSGGRELLEPVAAAIRDPRWGVWLGRKSCLPAAPLCPGGPYPSEDEAWQALLRAATLPADTAEADFAKVEEVTDFTEGTDTLNDSPLSFGTADSSGVDGRQFAPRRVRVVSPKFKSAIHNPQFPIN